MGKIAFCFWGLTRSLKYNMKSIQQNIFDVLTANGDTYDIFIHTYAVRRPYSNPRAKEIDIKLDNNEYMRLNPTKYKVEDLKIVDHKIGFDQYKTKGNPFKSKSEQTFRNQIRAMWSLKQVTSMWKEGDYSAVVYLRPDMRYPCPIRPEWLKVKDAILIPDFHRHTENGDKEKAVGDRFAIGPPHIMKLYGNRFDEALEYSKIKQLHSETFLEDMLSKHKIKIELINYGFVRVRANKYKDPRDTRKLKKIKCWGTRKA